ncbi:MAG TPA: hypothetical protein VED17_03020, partial [Nitrososphaerales archaeon]|nr:hypothetical protein [Nitrososphaerales archaeon]
ITKELSEIARFKREKVLELASILEGARIASTLKKFGAGTPEFEQFLNSVYSRSIEKGYTPNEIISQSSKLQALEKKYNMNFEALRSNFEELGKSLAVKKKEKSDLETEIAQAAKKKAELLGKFSLDEEKLQDYASSRQQLSTFGFDVAHLQNLRNFLVAARNENFDVREISTKLNAIGDLQLHKTKIQQEVKGIKEELDSKKKELDAIEIAAKDRIKKLEERFAKQKEEIDAYSELRAMGIEGKRILSWNQIIKAVNVDYGTIEGELRNQGNLKNLEDKTSAKIKELVSEEIRLGQSISELKREKENIETSIQTIKDSALNGIEELRAKVLSSIETMKEKAETDLETTAKDSQKSLEEMKTSSEQQLKQVSETALSDMRTTVTELKSSADEFSKGLKDSLLEASPEIKNVGMALEAGEKIGKYRNIMPLLQLIDGSGTQDESEALIAMWNLSSRFNAWLENHYPGEKRDISEPLMRLLESINNEIQRVGGA